MEEEGDGAVGQAAEYHGGFSVETIQRCGRWASNCWKIYVQDSRDTARDVAKITLI